MEYLHWELSILSRAVAYKNLSAAAQHIRLSQPQLSRIVSKLEAEMNLVLLDRDAKRKSGWTKSAFDLAQIYSKTFHQFRNEVDLLTHDGLPSHIAIGVLEGISSLGMRLCQHCFVKLKMQTVELHIYDQNELESNFFKGNLQAILSSRTPGMKKFKNVSELGFQSLTKVKQGDEFSVMSPFEFETSIHHSKRKKSSQATFVSNSLALRRAWLDQRGGFGLIPTELYQKPKNTDAELHVRLIGEDHMSPQLWGRLAEFSG